LSAAGASLDHTLIALADPTRRAILERLSGGELRVTDVAEPFAISLNSVSKHIRLLERAGLVRRRVRGREHLLSLDGRPLDAAAAWIEARRSLWAQRLQALDDLLRTEDSEQRAHEAGPRTTGKTSTTTKPIRTKTPKTKPTKKQPRGRP
jgi:DNA-binding transcriptional ArsR family regulator